MSYADIPVEGTTKTLLQLLKDKLDICYNDTSRDDELTMWLEIAGKAAEAYCQTVLAAQDVTERHAVTFSPVRLRWYPVADITNAVVMIDGEDVSADYEFFYDIGNDYITVNRNSANLPDGFKQMDITYNAGYDPLPIDLAYAIAGGAAKYDNEVVGTGEVKRESVVGVGTIEYATSADDTGNFGAYSASQLDILNHYRRMHV